MIRELALILIPAAFANIIPVLVRNIELFNYPINEELLGNHKTYRGFILGILISIAVILILKQNWKLGFVIGFSVLLGDLIGAFIKRKLGYYPGAKCFPLDQLSSPVFLALFLYLLSIVDLVLAFWIVLIWFLGHIFVRHLGYWLKINKEKW